MSDIISNNVTYFVKRKGVVTGLITPKKKKKIDDNLQKQKNCQMINQTHLARWIYQTEKKKNDKNKTKHFFLLPLRIPFHLL